MTVIAMSRTEIDRMNVLQDLAASRIKITEAATLIGLGMLYIRSAGPESTAIRRPDDWTALLGACLDSRCSILIESDFNLGL